LPGECAAHQEGTKEKKNHAGPGTWKKGITSGLENRGKRSLGSLKKKKKAD